jgi:copper oxidase (laccase) domain-containing protein
VAGLCTACRVDLFYSHRREGEPGGRFGALVALR